MPTSHPLRDAAHIQPDAGGDAAGFPDGMQVIGADGAALPLELRAVGRPIDLAEALAGANAPIRGLLRSHGALLFRGFSVGSAQAFKQAIMSFGSAPSLYSERSTPRTQIDGPLYTATEYPAREPIFLHNENSYASRWPRFLAFFCEQPGASGGEVMLADTREIYRRIPQSVRAACEGRGLRYTRRFIPGIGYSWQQAFGVADEEALMQMLAQQGYDACRDGDHLITERTASWSILHPETAEAVWFNHGIFFNAYSLPGNIRRSMEKLFGTGVYPFQTSYADGSMIDAETYEIIRNSYSTASLGIRMEAGDVLLIDNLLVAHGRQAYTGARKHYIVMLS